MRTTKKKKCTKCQKLLPLSEFTPSKTGKYGVYNHCKPCHLEYVKNQNPNRKEIDEKRAKQEGFRKLGLKRCSSCKNVHPLDNYYGDPRATSGKQSMCKDCSSFKYDRANVLKNFGLVSDEYSKMMEAQDGCCAICKRPSKRNLSVDHCHKTHIIRGLLCTNCNASLLPVIEGHQDWVENAIKYLAEYPAVAVIGEREIPQESKYRKEKAGLPLPRFNHKV